MCDKLRRKLRAAEYRKTDRHKATVENYLSGVLRCDICGAVGTKELFARKTKCKRCDNAIRRDKALNYQRTDKYKEFTEANAERLKEAKKESNARYRKNNADRIKELRDKWFKEHPEARKRYSAPLYKPSTDAKLLSELPLDAEAIMTESGIKVSCKFCGDRFLPTKLQIRNRIRAFNSPGGIECNFYCSTKCKQKCPVFNAKKFNKLNRPATVRCVNNELKSLQCDEVGYTYCERCGDIIDVEKHHSEPVALNKREADNAAAHILLCAGCHVELHRKCK